MTVRIRALRSFEVADDAGRVLALSGVQRRLLAVLVVHHDHVIALERLADVLDTSVRALHMTVVRLRAAAGRDLVSTVGRGYRLGPVELDIVEFETLVREAQDFAPAHRESALQSALQLASGEPYGEFSTEFWAGPEATRLRELRASAVEDRAEALLALGRFGEVSHSLIVHLTEFPFRDRPRALAMRSLAAQGRVTEALRLFHDYRIELGQEVGTEPSSELCQLESRIASGRHEEPSATPRVDLGDAKQHRSETMTFSPMLNPLREHPGGPFIGRVAEMSALIAALEFARQGRRRTVLVAGEAGAGKTRLALEFIRRATSAETLIVVGSCDVALSVPYRPWVQVLNVLADFLPEAGRARLADELDTLSVLVSTLGSATPAVPYVAALDPDTERDRLFLAFDRLVVEVANEQPVVIVLDDIHWADAHTLALFSYLARSVRPAGVLMIATFRDTADTMLERLAGFLMDLRRNAATDRMKICGFDQVQAREMIASLVGHPLDGVLGNLASSLAERSCGNPFYLGELWRHYESIGAITASEGRWSVQFNPARSDLPDTVREVVTVRLGRVSNSAHNVAALVALAGQRTDLRVLRCAHHGPPDELMEGIEELERAHLLVTTPGGPLPQVHFTHDIVRDAIVSGLGPATAARWHQALGRAIETVFAADLRPVLSDLAWHFTASASIGDPRVAVRYARLAAGQAKEAYAHDEAMALLDAAAALAAPGSAEAIDVLIDRTQVSARAGMDPQDIATLSSAVHLALDLGLVEQAARAAMELQTVRCLQGVRSSESFDLIQRVLDLPGFTDQRLRLRVRGATVRALQADGHREAADALAAAIVAEARTINDPAFLAPLIRDVLSDNYDARPEVLFSTGAEICDLASSIGDLWTFCWGAGNVVRSLLMLGRVHDAAAFLERHRDAANRGRYAIFRYQVVVYDAVLAIVEGRFDDAERHAERATQLFANHTGFDSGLYGLQMFIIRRGQGRLGEVAPLLQLASNTGGAVWRPGLAALFAQLDRRNDAQRIYAPLAAEQFASFPRDSMWPACLAFLAEVCVFVVDADHAPMLYDELAPFAGFTIMVAYTVCLGPADTLLGSLAALCGRPERAAAHFRVALEIAERAGSPTWIAEAQAARERALDT